MFVTYTPEGQSEPQTWLFVPGKVRNSRASHIEKLFAKEYGERQTFEQFKVAVQQGSSPARRVLLWHLQQQNHPTLRIEDVDFAEGELTVEFTVSELVEMRDLIARMKGTDEAQREQMLAAIDMQMETAPEDDGGKARPSSASTGTSSASLPTSPDSADPTSSPS